ncbi:stemmadenine O-acetyltransferase-like [Tripterygium wilfordii]|uniref:stemmadenine O-acetyltransferase-like n=1 Tax=Tripterygium wilfordii TaxID=458696 RepID=UPI0018F844BD|nr:stemmadenine O-acetyltransferase-like [Tripterygium wilfordii]
MEVEIISIKAIKPSYTTHHHHRHKTFKLSLLDQRVPPVYGGAVLFYGPSRNSDNIFSEFSKKSQHLQRSLSKTLVQFYPLAGSLKDDIFIDCNDEGACFIEAQIGCKLKDFLGKPDHELLNHLTPITDSKKAKFPNSLLLVQVTLFSCGGMSIAVFPSHKIADATSMGTFMQSWTAVNRNDRSKFVLPEFIEGSCLSRREFPNWNIEMPSEKQSTRRPVFCASKIASLKGATSQHRPSKVEVVLALIVRRAIAVSRASRLLSGKPFGRSVLFHFVNFRSKLVPPLPGNRMGNIIWSIPVVFEEDEMELNKMVGNISRSLLNFYNEDVNKFQGDELYEAMCKSLKEKRKILENSVNTYVCSSLCKISFYGVDFGWGKPLWVTSPNNARNKIVLLDTKCGDGVEAWVTLEEQEMARFERDEEILAYASLNPSVFCNSSRL